MTSFKQEFLQQKVLQQQDQPVATLCEQKQTHNADDTHKMA